MKRFLEARPRRKAQRSRAVICQSLALVLTVGSVAAWPQAKVVAAVLGQSPMLLMGSPQQGYLGVELADIDAPKAQTLKLKDAHGVLITLIDHDAPAGQIGLRVNDVVLALNGDPVQTAEQLRKKLKEIPPGRKVSIVISREGNVQTMAVELADRKAVEHDVWNKIDNGGDAYAGTPAMSMMGGKGGGDAPASSGFHLPFFGGSVNVGVLVEPLTTQMAEYMGVEKGLMVKQVARKSAAAAAGLKAFDVILRVGSVQIANLSAWDRAMHSNQGKTVQVTVLRDKKLETVTLQVDSKRHS
jgi:S1-C subfamily serine protease